MKFIKDHLLLKAKSRQHFFTLLQDNGLTVQYTNRGVPTGILDTNGKSYSWKKLGIEAPDFHALNDRALLLSIDERLHKLEQIRKDQQHSRSLEP